MSRQLAVAAGGLALAALLVVGGLPGGARAQDVPEAVAYCLNCHADKQLSLKLGDGTAMSLHIEGKAFAESVHGGHLVCTDCHPGYDDKHPSGKTVPSRRAYSLAAYETCKKCHFDTYTRTLESVHYELLKSGLDVAPVCTDCHGAHGIQNPHEKRAMISRSCATCHDGVYKRYAKSVHGKALVAEGNQDVPACADCHTHHQIQHPGTPQFRLSSPDMCIRCHQDERLMTKYGISTNVVQTYLTDFHGVTASLARVSPVTARQVVVTCIDCHGVHDIASPRLVGAETMKASVARACARCHAGASPAFPAAWLSHYEPSLRHAPLVFLIGIFYKVFIPFVVVGLVLHVLLDLYRVSAGR